MASARPNFLLIVADDLGFSDLGSFGAEIATPCLDALAYAGVRLTDFHSAPACSPTRAMLMSGTDPHLAGIGAMSDTLRPDFPGAPGYEGFLHERIATIAELLGNGGYRSIMSGKWHLGDAPEHWPAARGFERSFALLPAAHDHFGREMTSPAFPNPLYAEDHAYVRALPDGFYSSDYFATRLIEFFGEAKSAGDERPFFAYLPFSAPHFPLQAPDAEIAKYRGFYNAGPDVLRDKRLQQLLALGLMAPGTVPHPVVTKEPGWNDLTAAQKAFSARTMEIYAAMVDRMDQNVGRIVDYLKAAGQFDNTVIVFLSDNGAEGAIAEAMPIYGPGMAKRIRETCNNSLENLGRPLSYIWYGPRWAQAATAPSRLMKAYTTEGGIRVPAFIHWPAAQRRGVDGAFSTAMDIAPTFLDLAGIAHPAPSYKGREILPMRGRSLRPLLEGRATQVHPAGTSTGWELFGRRALRHNDWKIVYVPGDDGVSRWQLYNLAQDRGEIEDLAETEPDKLNELLGLWRSYVADTGVIETPLSIFDADPSLWLPKQPGP
jgi:arylsulfatase